MNANGDVEVFALPETASASDQPVTYSNTKRGVVQFLGALSEVNFQGYLQTSLLDIGNPIDAVVGADIGNVIQESVSGPKYVCRPNWTNFLSNIGSRGQVLF
jgi:hypothetical protein